MDWIQAVISTNSDGIEPVCAVLMQHDILGVEILDKEDFKSFLENNRKYWDYVDEELERLKDTDTQIKFYVSRDAEGHAKINEIQEALDKLFESGEDYGTLRMRCFDVRDEDWENNWKEFFKSTEVGERVLIKPEWEELEYETDRVIFTVNPGLCFGTGTHDTTRFCIEELEKYVNRGKSVLDLGCGSGILSIIALLLGAENAVAVDIDEKAVGVAYQNLELNGLPDEKYHVMCGDIACDVELRDSLGTYDVVLANIVSDVIISISDYVHKLMKDDGIFICSGIIADREAEVREELEKSELNILNTRRSDDWTAFVCKKA